MLINNGHGRPEQLQKLHIRRIPVTGFRHFFSQFFNAHRMPFPMPPMHLQMPRQPILIVPVCLPGGFQPSFFICNHWAQFFGKSVIVHTLPRTRHNKCQEVGMFRLLFLERKPSFNLIIRPSDSFGGGNDLAETEPPGKPVIMGIVPVI